MEESGAREGERLNKYIAESGVCSRRAADRLIEEGRAEIDGRRAVVGDRVLPGQTVKVDGKTVEPEEEDIILAFHKPRGLTCTSDPGDPDSVISYIGYPKRIYSVGRLDKDSEGLLLLTNNGDLANRIMRARYDHEKEYVVTVDRPVTDDFVRKMGAGVPLEEGLTRECSVCRTGEREFTIILQQGINRQVRRMCEYFGYDVTRLVRVRVVNILLGDMRSGKYRSITKAERAALFESLGL
jgi:23S rRNA pseudouridine2604 synthase